MPDKILVVKCDTYDEYCKACDKFDSIGCVADNGAGKPGHRLNGYGSTRYDFNLGVRYLVKHGDIVKKAITNNFGYKFNVISVAEFLTKQF